MAGVADALTSLHLVLNYIEHLRRNDRRVAVFNIVLGNLAFVDLLLLGQKINGVLFLQNGVALVFLIGQDALDRAALPLLLSGWGWNVLAGEQFGDAGGGVALKKELINQTYDFGLFFHDFGKSVFALFVAEKMFVGQADFAIYKTLSLTPCDILGNTAAFFLS